MTGRPVLDHVPEYAFALAALVAPPLAVLVPYGMAVELPILGVISAAMLWRRRQFRLVPVRALALVGVLCAWAVVTLVWALGPDHGAVTIFRVAALALAGVLAMGMARLGDLGGSRLLLAGLAVGVVAATVLLVADVTTGNGLSAEVARFKGALPLPESWKSQLNRGATVLALLVWPLALLVWRQRWRWLLASIVLAMVALLFVDSFATRLAMGSGAVTLLVVRAWPTAGLRVLKGMLVVATLALPQVMPRLPAPPVTFDSMPWLPLSAHHRLVIWHFAAERIAEHPLWGWGMDASRTIPGGDETVWIEDYYPLTHGVRRVISGALMPLHPHNAILQWRLELGVPGALAAAVALWCLVGRIQRSPELDRGGRATAAAVCVAGMVVSCVSYGAWQSWWLASLWLAAALCLAAGRRRTP